MRKPPRLVVRALTAAFVTVAAILSIVFTILMVDARDRVRAAEIEKLRVAEQVFTALDTYFTESRFAALAVEAIAELLRHAGTQCDEAAVDALAVVLPEIAPASRAAAPELVAQAMV